MINVVIGQSGAGKTTFCKRRFFSSACDILTNYPVPVTKSGDIYALGKYGIGKRTEGTDTLSYSALPKIIETVRALIIDGHTDIVMEGDRINNEKMFAFLASLDIPVKLFLIHCKLDTSMQRLRAAGSKISLTFVKCTQTKSRNNFLTWAGKFCGEAINTDER